MPVPNNCICDPQPDGTMIVNDDCPMHGPALVAARAAQAAGTYRSPTPEEHEADLRARGILPDDS
jgi:hypothetical protein